MRYVTFRRVYLWPHERVYDQPLEVVSMPPPDPDLIEFWRYFDVEMIGARYRRAAIDEAFGKDRTAWPKQITNG